jgi:aspartyl-tRNA synthetase
LRNEYVVRVRGLVRARPAGTANANLASGQV